MVRPYLFVMSSLFLILSAGEINGRHDHRVIEISEMIDSNSTTGKEERIAVMLAIQGFKNHSLSYNLSLRFTSPSRGPLKSAYAGEELIKEKKVKIIIGKGRREEVAAVADVASQAQVPVSFSPHKILNICVPAKPSFEQFVKLEDESQNKYEGFCIELFDKVQARLNYTLKYTFVPHHGTYNDLVDRVYNKTCDAIVGDVTILADRLDKVEFTQPYLESELSLIVPAKSEGSTWVFAKPFTSWVWLTTCGILLYTMFVVWFLERKKNPEFNGSWKDQISVAIMFTFSSLFFAHQGKLYNHLTRVVLIVWLFVVLFLTQSYTASLASILTIKQLQPKITDIDWLVRNNKKVGCDGDSFTRKYLEEVLKFKHENIINVDSEDKYPGEFESGRISAAFLELPYEKVFINDYCKQFTATMPGHKFGGLGFVFQKGSPIAANVSKAILTLLENGELKSLEDKWFEHSRECSSNSTDNVSGGLTLDNFWFLYLLSATTSTTCFLIFFIISMRKYLKYQANIERQNATSASRDDSVWSKTVELARFIYHGEEVAMATEQR